MRTASNASLQNWSATILWVVVVGLAGVPAILLSWFVATYQHASDLLMCPEVDRAWALAAGLACVGLGPAIVVLGLGMGLRLSWLRPFIAALCIGIVSMLAGAYWMEHEKLSLSWAEREECLHSGMR